MAILEAHGGANGPFWYSEKGVSTGDRRERSDQLNPWRTRRCDQQE